MGEIKPHCTDNDKAEGLRQLACSIANHAQPHQSHIKNSSATGRSIGFMFRFPVFAGALTESPNKPDHHECGNKGNKFNSPGNHLDIFFHVTPLKLRPVKLSGRRLERLPTQV
jgi:hypothetical protein